MKTFARWAPESTELIPESAGILDQVVRVFHLNSAVEVCNPLTFYPGQTVKVFSKDMVYRGSFTIRKERDKAGFEGVDVGNSLLVADGPLPVGTTEGDLLIVSEWRGLGRK
jgi:hypothetical protein